MTVILYSSHTFSSLRLVPIHDNTHAVKTFQRSSGALSAPLYNGRIYRARLHQHSTQNELELTISAQLSHFPHLKKRHSVCLTTYTEQYRSRIVANTSSATSAPSMKSAPRTPPLHLSKSNLSALRAAILQMKFQRQITFTNTSFFEVATSRI